MRIFFRKNAEPILCPNVINAVLNTFHIYLGLLRDLKQLKRCNNVVETTMALFGQPELLEKEIGISRRYSQIQHILNIGFMIIVLRRCYNLLHFVR